jgi:hypothetical protein
VQGLGNHPKSSKGGSSQPREHETRPRRTGARYGNRRPSRGGGGESSTNASRRRVAGVGQYYQCRRESSGRSYLRPVRSQASIGSRQRRPRTLDEAPNFTVPSGSEARSMGSQFEEVPLLGCRGRFGPAGSARSPSRSRRQDQEETDAPTSESCSTEPRHSGAKCCLRG